MEKRKLRRRVLLGLTLGTTGFALLPALPAQAMTLTEYKQALAEGRAYHLDVDDFSAKVVTTKQLASTPEQKKILRAAGPSGEVLVQMDDGTKLGPAEIRSTNIALDHEGNIRKQWTYRTNNENDETSTTDELGHTEDNGEIYFGDGVHLDNHGIPNADINNSSAVVDATDTKFVGSVHQLNGTVIAKAENIFGSTAYDANAGWHSGGYTIGSDEEMDEDMRKIGHVVNATATLRLVGNTLFNTDWTDEETGETYVGKNCIKLTNKGILEANSAQLFDVSLGDGSVTNPEKVRADADTAINFLGGTVLLDDSYYNNDYLANAQKLVRAADGGTTQVAMSKASKFYVEPTDLADVKEDGAFIPVKTDLTEATIVAKANERASRANKVLDQFNGSMLRMGKPVNGRLKLCIYGTKATLGDPDSTMTELITEAGKTPESPAQITVGDKGALTLGTNQSKDGTVNSLKADVTLGDGTAKNTGTLTAASATQQVNSITAKAGSDIKVAAPATLETTDGIKLDGASQLAVQGVVKSKVTAGSDATISVGSDESSESAGELHLLAGSSLAETKVFLDPAWKDDAEITDASQLADAGTDASYLLTVGQNAVASFGTDDPTHAQQAFANSRQTWGNGDDEVSAALYLAKPVSVAATGGIKVDGAVTSGNFANGSNGASADTVTFGEHSLLMVDAGALGSSAALTAADGKGTLRIADSAKLYLDDVADGKAYTIVDRDTSDGTGFANLMDAKGWYTDTSKIITNKRYRLDTTQSNTDGVIHIVSNPYDVDGLALKNTLDAMDDAAANRAKYAGINYLYQAEDGLYSDDMTRTLVNIAAQPAEVAGASYYAAQTVNDLSDAVQQRGSLLTTENGLHPGEFWLQYGHRHTNMDTLQLTGLTSDADSNTNTVTLGYDFAGGKVNQGIAFSYGTGKSDGSYEDDRSRTYGASYYGNLLTYHKADQTQNNLLFDLGAYRVKHDIDGVLDGNFHQTIVTAGIRDEYSLPQADGAAIVPHVGLRWLGMHTPSYTMKWNGSPAFHYAPETQHLFTVPIGVGFTFEKEKCGWNYKALLDLSYLGKLGSGRGTMRVGAFGVDASDLVDYDILGKSSYGAKIALTAENKNMSYAISYRYQGNSDMDSHTFGVQFGLKF